MIDLKSFINDMIKHATVSEKATAAVVAAFLDDNDWFGMPPSYENQQVLLTDEQVKRYTPPILFFLSSEKNSAILLGLLTEKYGLTHDCLQEFFAEEDVPEKVRFAIVDFLLFYLDKDILLYTNNEASALVQIAANELTKFHGDVFTLFLAWLRAHKKTRYNMDYVMAKRYTIWSTAPLNAHTALTRRHFRASTRLLQSTRIS